MLYIRSDFSSDIEATIPGSPAVFAKCDINNVLIDLDGDTEVVRFFQSLMPVVTTGPDGNDSYSELETAPASTCDMNSVITDQDNDAEVIHPAPAFTDDAAAGFDSSFGDESPSDDKLSAHGSPVIHTHHEINELLFDLASIATRDTQKGTKNLPFHRVIRVGHRCGRRCRTLPQP